MLKMPLLPSRGPQGLPVVPRSLSVHRSFPFLFQPAATLAKGKYTYGLFSVLKRYYMIGERDWEKSVLVRACMISLVQTKVSGRKSRFIGWVNASGICTGQNNHDLMKVTDDEFF